MHSDTQIGDRIREERQRLGMAQQQAATAAGVRREMWAKYESGAEPGAKALAGMAAMGVDVHYVLVGERDASRPALDASERVLLEHYRRCSPEGRAHLVQSSALLAAGLGQSPGQGVVQTVLAPVTAGGVAGRDINYGTRGRTKR